MEKTKLGISVGIMGALLYAIGLFAGYLITIAAVAYVLIREESSWLRKTAVKIIALVFLFPVIRTALGVIPDLISFVDDIMNIFDEYFTLNVVTRIITVLLDIVNIAEYVIFIILGFMALNQKTLKLPLLDSAIGKHMD